MIGAIEAGGTKFVCGIATHEGNWVDRIQFPTEHPGVTMAKVTQFFQRYPLDAIGVGSFGPCGVDRDKKDYGFITSTPKQGWNSYGMVPALKEVFNIPIGFTTDVNAAALGEYMSGAGKKTKSALYVTIGTGIGAGAVIDGAFLQGLSHPEMGHIYVRRHPEDSYEGTCPYHKDCLEGLAAGPSLEARYSVKGDQLEPDHPVWEVEAYYLAQAVVQYVLIMMPEKIILGGGVMKQTQLYPLIQKQVESLLNGYVHVPDLNDYIVPPALGDNAGMTGAFFIGKNELEQRG